MAETKRQKEMREERETKINALIDKLGSNRIGVLSRDNAELVCLLVEDVWTMLGPSKKGETIGHLNEILCYLAATIELLPKEGKRNK